MLRLEHPTNGILKRAHRFEVQFNTPHMQAAKGAGHKHYEIDREFEYKRESGQPADQGEQAKSVRVKNAQRCIVGTGPKGSRRMPRASARFHGCGNR